MLRQDISTHDSGERATSHTDPKNNTTTFTRDGMGRITQVTYQDQSTKTYSYDCCRLNTVTDSVGTLTFAYDTLKRLSSLTDVYNKTISYGYDKNNNLTTLTYPDSKVVSYEYDKADRLIKVTDWLSNVTTYTYDLAVNLIKTTYPDGSTVEYRYDNASRLKTIIDSKPDGTLNAVFNYAFDSLGNRTVISSKQPLNAIPSLPDTSYTHNADNRLLTAGSTTFEYDNNGNLITKTLGGNVTNYTWDFNDMLAQVTSGGNTYVYRYDGLGHRVARIENSTEKRYVGGLAETDASGNITAYYVYGLGLISKITPSNQPYFYHFDGIASTVGISDSSGNMVNKYAYDAFGKVLNQEEAIPNPFKYVGQFGLMDEGNGLFYMRARYYDPEMGRFISKDPIGFLGGLNLYAYVDNNPVNFIDPLGLYSFDDFIEDASNFSAGFGDTITSVFGILYLFGLPSGTQWVRQQRGWDVAVNPCSGWYKGGKVAGYAWGIALGGRIGVRPGGFLNSNRYLRIGFGRKGGNRVFRIGGQWLEKVTGRGHLDIWEGGPL
jgi:RHS repeat-associated protein